jgi:N-methylhydantoinase B
MATEKKDKTDAFTMQLIYNFMSSIVDEMCATVVRTSFSPLIRDAFDFAAGICDAKGEIVAEGLVMAIHSLVYPPFIKHIMNIFGNDIHRDDLFISNDPYSRAAHLPDIYIAHPIFIGNELVAWSVACGHQRDMGGRVAGSNACDCTEIYQEGLRIPLMKLYNKGKANDTILKVIEANVRVPQIVIADIQALKAACQIGEVKFLELAETYGWEVLNRYLQDLVEYSERRVRAEISVMPDGVYEFTDYLDDDGFRPDPVRFTVKITVDKDTMTYDFTGSSPQVKAGINNPLGSTMACVNCALRCLISPDIPTNSGVMRPIKIIAPEGTIVNPVLPAPVAGRGVTLGRLLDTLLGAEAKIAPERIFACASNADIGVSIGGYEGRSPFIYTEFWAGGWGGRPSCDGVDACSPIWANGANQVCEIIESLFPLRIRSVGYMPDTEGAGKYRGALSTMKDIEVLADEATFQLRVDRVRFGCYGLQGGQEGAHACVTYNPDGENRKLPKTVMTVKKGDVIRLQAAGAGGFGNPAERDVEMVRNDVHNGLLSPRRAREVYGVVMDENSFEIDVAETKRLREGMKRGVTTSI